MKTQLDKPRRVSPAHKNRLIQTPLKTLAAVACVFGLSSVAHATVLVNDNFTNSTGSSVSTVNNTESIGVGTHNMINGSNALSVVTPSFFGSSKALQMNVGSGNVDYRAFDGATTLTLNSLAVGESLTLSFDVGFNADPTANLSFGFVNTTTPNSVIYVNEALTASTSNYRFRSSSAFMSAGSGSAIGSNWTASDTAQSTSYHYELEVTKLTGGDFQLDYLVNSGLVNSQTVLASSTWVTTMGGVDITGVAFRNESAGSASLFIDNISVITVPEPSTWVLAALGLTSVMVFRRRSRVNG
ncbi:MAG: PEP-CTERM sorting domain-containing protein [Terrimicrobiaceae bacterium]